jgi:undecaprenyl-diphosphatase
LISFYDFMVAVILGLVEGATEFIPVSSTGHLILVSNLLNFTGDRAESFAIFIQLGAILAVVILYRQRFFDLLKFQNSQGFSGLRGIGLLIVAMLPLVVGYFAYSFIKDVLLKPGPVTIALLIGGVAMIIVERVLPAPKIDSLDEMTWRQALGIGLFQVLSMWPGMSRAAATIVGGMIVGMRRDKAAEFSFLLAVPTMVAAVGYDMLKSYDTLNSSDFLMFGIGFVVAFLAALAAIRTFIQLLQRHTLTPFGWYRIGLAVVVGMLFMMGYIHL